MFQVSSLHIQIFRALIRSFMNQRLKNKEKNEIQRDETLHNIDLKNLQLKLDVNFLYARKMKKRNRTRLPTKSSHSLIP